MISLHGAYYNNNFGDLLLIKIFENWIKSKVNQTIVYPLVPKADRDSFRSHFPKATIGLEKSQHWQALIYAGGGYFGEPESNRNKTFGGKWNKRFFRLHVLPAEICLWRDIPYAILGVEAGPLSNIFVRQEVRRIVKNARVLSVRNIESKQFLQEELGIRSQINVAPDAALALNETDIPTAALEFVTQRLAPYKGMVLLGIHQPSLYLRKNPQAELLRKSLLASLTLASDVIPILFSDDGDIHSSQKSCNNLAQIIQSSTGKQCLEFPFQGLWETTALISQLSAVLTPKLHVGIVAYGLGVYCESFANHQKTPRFYRQIDRPSQCTMLNNVTEDTVMEKIDRAIQSSRRQVSIRDQNWYKLKEEARLNQSLLFSFLDSVVSSS